MEKRGEFRAREMFMRQSLRGKMSGEGCGARYQDWETHSDVGHCSAITECSVREETVTEFS